MSKEIEYTEIVFKKMVISTKKAMKTKDALHR